MISKIKLFELENRKLIMVPLQIIASILVIAGSFALMFEVTYFAEFSLDIYFGRVIATLIGFIVLILTNFNIGKKNPTLLIHVLLVTIIASFASIIIRIPDSLYFNSHLLALVVFTSALFLSWDLKNQIIVAIYYNLIFASSILLTDSSVYILPSMYASVLYVVVISLLSVVATSINYGMRQKAITKSLEAKDFFENSNEALFKVSLDDNQIKIFNNAFKALLLSTENRISEYFFKDIFASETDYNIMLGTINETDILSNYTVHLKKNENESFLGALNARKYEDVNGVHTIEGSIRDITTEKIAEEKIKKYNEELQLLNNSKDKFFSIVAHDLVSPFSTVIGYSEILIDEYKSLPREQIGQFAGDIHSVSQKANKLLTELLDWSRIQTGRMQYDPQVIGLKVISGEILSLFDELAKKKNINLINEVDESFNVFADYKMLGTSIRNLVSNALKFTKSGGFVMIRSTEKKDFIELTVQDNGVGMKPEVQSKIFQIDVHHTQLGTQKERGTGLGLILTQEFVRKNGGNIWVESEVDKGSKFIFTIPKDEASIKKDNK
jgi:two-component system sensor histidine kinase/response regulator